MKTEYYIIFDRDNHTKTVPQRIAKLKDYLNSEILPLKFPFFCSVGFVGGSGLNGEQSTFNLTVFIDNDIKSRYDLNSFILDTFKGQTVYIYENNRLPYKLQ